MAAADCPATGLLATAATEADKLDHDILDAMIKLFRQILAQSERLAERYGVPLFCVKALHILDTSMAMKELGQRMGCDPSFVTAIADTLEKRGLAKREASAADRRVKNLVLSTDGIELKGLMEAEMLASMPWSRALDTAERETFLSLDTQACRCQRHRPGRFGACRAGQGRQLADQYRVAHRSRDCGAACGGPRGSSAWASTVRGGPASRRHGVLTRHANRGRARGGGE